VAQRADESLGKRDELDELALLKLGVGENDRTAPPAAGRLL